MESNFTHVWRDSFNEYSRDIKDHDICTSGVLTHSRLRDIFGWNFNVSMSFRDVICKMSGAYNFILNSQNYPKDLFDGVSDIWDVLSCKRSNDSDKQCMYWDLVEKASDDDFVKSVVEFREFLDLATDIQGYVDWILSKEVRKSMDDCISVSSKINLAQNGVICTTDWSTECIKKFYNNDKPVECHYAQCYMSFPNFKEFLKFQYNLATDCNKSSYKFRFKDICSGNVYTEEVSIGSSFEDFLGGFLKTVGAESKNLWDDGSGNYALFYGDDEIGGLYNEMPSTGIVHYRVYIPVPMGSSDGSGVSKVVPELKLGYFFGDNKDGRVPVSNLGPSSAWLDVM